MIQNNPHGLVHEWHNKSSHVHPQQSVKEYFMPTVQRVAVGPGRHFRLQISSARTNNSLFSLLSRIRRPIQFSLTTLKQTQVKTKMLSTCEARWKGELDLAGWCHKPHHAVHLRYGQEAHSDFHTHSGNCQRKEKPKFLLEIFSLSYGRQC